MFWAWLSPAQWCHCQAAGPDLPTFPVTALTVTVGSGRIVTGTINEGHHSAECLRGIPNIKDRSFWKGKWGTFARNNQKKPETTPEKNKPNQIKNQTKRKKKKSTTTATKKPHWKMWSAIAKAFLNPELQERWLCCWYSNIPRLLVAGVSEQPLPVLLVQSLSLRLSGVFSNCEQLQALELYSGVRH